MERNVYMACLVLRMGYCVSGIITAMHCVMMYTAKCIAVHMFSRRVIYNYMYMLMQTTVCDHIVNVIWIIDILLCG
jgi:hypothetical protein